MKKAFTLIELLMVIAIIAIISTLAVSKVGGVREAAARKVSLANQKAVERAVEAFLVSGGKLNRLDNLMYANCTADAEQSDYTSAGARIEFNDQTMGDSTVYFGPSDLGNLDAASVTDKNAGIHPI
jgi:prepilin-type N-terminal cleavage/methylation domain-containing protein